MHDPSTVAFDIPGYKFRQTRFGRYVPDLLTIWHEDPETDGSDDSCDWPYFKFAPAEKEYMQRLLDDKFDFGLSWDHIIPKDDYERKRALYMAFRVARRLYRPRPWWRHPRWHLWHWRFQVHPVQQFKRWAWSRCMHCGGRFRWGESPVSYAGWNDHEGPRWFGGEPKVAHLRCDYNRVRPLISPSQISAEPGDPA